MLGGNWARLGIAAAAPAAVRYGFDEFELDARTPELRRNGQPVKADAVSLRLLLVLLRSAGQVVAKRELISQVWDGRAVSDNVITVTMVRLRKTLGQQRGEREFVVNVHGRGYRFARPVQARDSEPAPLLTRISSEPSGPPFVGRARVLERLRELWQQARSERGSACVLSGEPGIGKTRAVEVLEREVRAAGAFVAWGYCREAGDAPPLWPWLQLARAVTAELQFKGLAQQLGPAVSELARVLPELSDAKQDEPSAELAPGAFEQSSAAKHRVFDALTRLFTLASERVGCVLVLDDLHRADPASLELLRYWIDEIPRSHALLLATMREHWDALGTRANADLTHVLGHRNCERIALARLHQQDVMIYVAALLDDPGGALGRAVFEKSEGNAFFMVELARGLRSADKADAKLLAVPDAALDLVRQRVAQLDAATRGVLSSAAVIGRTFEFSVLQAMTEDEPSALMAGLDRASASEVVRASPDSHSVFTFGHELLRAALYDALAPNARRSAHRRVGRALEQRLLAGEPVAPAELAYHFHAALPESDLRSTVQHCMNAAWAAAAVYANADVVRHLRHALEALDAMPSASPRLRITLLLRQAQFARADSPAEFEPMIREIIRFASQIGSGVVLAYAALLSNADAGFPPIMASQGVLDLALQLLPEGEAELRAAILARLALRAPSGCDAQRSDELLDRASELCEAVSDSPMGRYNVLAAQLYLEGGPVHVERANARLHELDRLCAKHSDTMTIPPPLLDLHRAIVALQHGEMKAMQASLESCAARAQRIQHRELIWHSERFRLMARINAGELVRVRPELDALHRRASHERILGTALFCLYDRTVVLDERDRWPDDVPTLDLEDAPNVLSLRMRALVATGQHDHARAALELLPPAQLPRLPCDRDYLGTLSALARCTLALGASEYFDPLYQLLAPYPKLFAVNVSLFCEGPVALWLGLLAHARGRKREAIAHLEASVAQAQRAGFSLAADEALRALTRCGA